MKRTLKDKINARRSSLRQLEKGALPSGSYNVVLLALKTWSRVFVAVWEGDKTFEIRKDDRGFAVGDMLALEEWDPKTDRYTGRALLAEVVWILCADDMDGLAPGHVAMAIKGRGRISR